MLKCKIYRFFLCSFILICSNIYAANVAILNRTGALLDGNYLVTTNNNQQFNILAFHIEDQAEFVFHGIDNEASTIHLMDIGEAGDNKVIQIRLSQHIDAAGRIIIRDLDELDVEIENDNQAIVSIAKSKI